MKYAGDYARRRDYKREYNNRWLRRDPTVRMINAARIRARKLGVPFEITRQDVVIPKECPALGIPLAVCDGAPGDGSPTLDRLFPDRGYVRGNTYVVSHLANRIKNKATPAQLMAVAQWVQRMHRD